MGLSKTKQQLKESLMMDGGEGGADGERQDEPAPGGAEPVPAADGLPPTSINVSLTDVEQEQVISGTVAPQPAEKKPAQPRGVNLQAH